MPDIGRSDALDAALEAYETELSKDPENHPSQHDIAKEFKILQSALSKRLNGQSQSRRVAFEHLQSLSPGEEDCLVNWLRHMSVTAQPQTPGECIHLANEIIKNRVRIDVSLEHLDDQSLGQKWFKSFKRRHPMVRSMFSRVIDHKRVQSTTPEALKAWFNDLAGLYAKHHYNPANIYNMDETGYAIGKVLSKRVLMVLEQPVEEPGTKGKKTKTAEKQAWHAAKDKGEWVTSIECISAAGRAIPPLVILKGQGSFNHAWAPAEGDCPVDISEWSYRASKKGWTCHDTAYRWMRDVFEPHTRPSVVSLERERRLLIMDGHGSHIQSRIVAFCMQNDIDIAILPPHTSSLTQPLDVSVFGPLKGAMSKQVDEETRLCPGSIPKPRWIVLLAESRKEAMNNRNIRSGFKNSGIWPLRPDMVSPLSLPASKPTSTLGIPRSTSISDTTAVLQAHAPNLPAGSRQPRIHSMHYDWSVIPNRDQFLRGQMTLPSRGDLGSFVRAR